MSYAFWRRPDGSRHRGKDDGGYAPASILAWLGENATVNGQEISWPGTQLYYMEVSAYPSIAIYDPKGRELNEDDSQSIVHNSLLEVIRELGGKKPIPARKLLDSVEKKAAEFFPPAERDATDCHFPVSQGPASDAHRNRWMHDYAGQPFRVPLPRASDYRHKLRIPAHKQHSLPGRVDFHAGVVPSPSLRRGDRRF
jgi:hypothetical protein